MAKVTVNVLVEIDGKSYKASNGVNVSGAATERDIMNLVNFGAKQILAEAGQSDTRTHIHYDVQAQDAVEIDE